MLRAFRPLSTVAKIPATLLEGGSEGRKGSGGCFEELFLGLASKERVLNEFLIGQEPYRD